MKKRVWMTLVAATCVTGCAVLVPGPGRTIEPDSAHPTVAVVGQTVRLNPEVLNFQVVPGADPITVTWRLPPGSNYRFAARGIVIDGRLTDQMLRGDRPAVVLDPNQTEVVDCKPVDREGLAYSCLNRRTVPGIYKYTIRLTNGQSEIVRDPSMANW